MRPSQAETILSAVAHSLVVHHYSVAGMMYIPRCWLALAMLGVCIALLCFLIHALSRVSSVVGSSPTRGSSFFLGKMTALGVLCCFALLFV